MELTPRVGDRVIVKGGTYSWSDPHHFPTTTGYVVDKRAGVRVEWSVRVDTHSSPAWFPTECLTVVDREPVEWPEGWSFGGDFGGDLMAYHLHSNVSVRKSELEFILATGPDMLARWDELMGEQ